MSRVFLKKNVVAHLYHTPRVCFAVCLIFECPAQQMVHHSNQQRSENELLLLSAVINRVREVRSDVMIFLFRFIFRLCVHSLGNVVSTHRRCSRYQSLWRTASSSNSSSNTLADTVVTVVVIMYVVVFYIYVIVIVLLVLTVRLYNVSLTEIKETVFVSYFWIHLLFLNYLFYAII